MTTAKYPITLTLTLEEEKRLQQLREKGIKTIEIFRCGLRLIEKETIKGEIK